MINVIEYITPKNAFYPVLCPARQYEEEGLLVIDLLIVDQHFLAIYKFGALINERSHHPRLLYCKNCLSSHTSFEIFDTHVKWCKTHGPATVQMPSPEKRFIKFSEQSKVIKLPFIIIWDSEQVLKPVSGPSNAIQEHLLVSYTILIARLEGPDPPSTYPRIEKKYQRLAEENMGLLLARDLKKAVEYVEKHRPNVPARITPEERQHYQSQTTCAECGKVFGGRIIKNFHHCHSTGRYLVSIKKIDT